MSSDDWDDGSGNLTQTTSRKRQRPRQPRSSTMRMRKRLRKRSRSGRPTKRRWKKNASKPLPTRRPRRSATMNWPSAIKLEDPGSRSTKRTSRVSVRSSGCRSKTDPLRSRISELQEMAIAEELFEDPGVKTLDGVGVMKTEDDHSLFAARVIKTLRRQSANELHVPGFLIQLVRKGCQGLESEEIAAVRNVVTTLYNERNKQEKGKQKKKKPAIKAGKATNRLHDDVADFLGSDDGEFEGKVDDGDFDFM